MTIRNDTINSMRTLGRVIIPKRIKDLTLILSNESIMQRTTNDFNLWDPPKHNQSTTLHIATIIAFPLPHYRLPLRRGAVVVVAIESVEGWGVEPRMAPPPSQGVQHERGRRGERCSDSYRERGVGDRRFIRLFMTQLGLYRLLQWGVKGYTSFYMFTLTHTHTYRLLQRHWHTLHSYTHSNVLVCPHIHTYTLNYYWFHCSLATHAHTYTHLEINYINQTQKSTRCPMCAVEFHRSEIPQPKLIISSVCSAMLVVTFIFILYL